MTGESSSIAYAAGWSTEVLTVWRLRCRPKYGPVGWLSSWMAAPSTVASVWVHVLSMPTMAVTPSVRRVRRSERRASGLEATSMAKLFPIVVRTLSVPYRERVDPARAVAEPRVGAQLEPVEARRVIEVPGEGRVAARRVERDLQRVVRAEEREARGGARREVVLEHRLVVVVDGRRPHADGAAELEGLADPCVDVARRPATRKRVFSPRGASTTRRASSK